MAADYFGQVVELDLPKKTSKYQTVMVKPVKRWLEHFWSHLFLDKKSGLKLKTAWQRLKARVRGER